MDKDLIREIARQRQFDRIACYRITGQEATLILDTKSEQEDTWPPKIDCDQYYYTQNNRVQLTFGWQATPAKLTKNSPVLKSSKSYLPPQDLWSTKFIFIVKKDGRTTGATGDLDGFLESLARRMHFWVASDELRHFIDDTTNHEQIHAFGAMLSRMIGHEMRNPVTNLLSLAQTHAMLWKDAGSEAASFAGEVEHYAQNIWDVIQKLEVLAANGTENFHSQEPTQVFDVKALVVHECNREQKHFDKGLNPHFNLTIADGNYNFAGVSSLIRLAFREVLHNAFTYAGGSAVHVSLYTGGGSIILDISDDGAPVPPGQDELMFMRYFQGPKASNQKGTIRRGLGLGLYLARFVSTFHNGQLIFVRGIGKKGCFRFMWPQHQPQQRAS
jgi:signal transduction histidine kinase